MLWEEAFEAQRWSMMRTQEYTHHLWATAVRAAVYERVSQRVAQCDEVSAATWTDARGKRRLEELREIECMWYRMDLTDDACGKQWAEERRTLGYARHIREASARQAAYERSPCEQ